jgi:Icc protein
MTESKNLNSVSPSALRILQISDTHLYGDTSRRLAGMDTDESLREVLQLAKDTLFPVDLILATGDLVHDSSPEGYQRLRNLFKTLNTPVYFLPGNHDNIEIMAPNLQASSVSMPAAADHGPWLIVMLNSSLRDAERGHLAQTELEKLDESLSKHPDKHIMICLHHQPVPSGSAWLDKMALDNPQAFFSVIDRYSNVRCVLWGHIHQTFESERNGVLLRSTPSTCIQFSPNNDKFQIDPLPPGFRWLNLLPNGQIETGVEHLTATPAGLNLKTAGYR